MTCEVKSFTLIEEKMLDAREQKTSKAINKDIMKIQNIISQHFALFLKTALK